MAAQLVEREYLIRRKILTIMGAKFHIYDSVGNLIGYSQQKAFRLKEDIRVYGDETRTEEKLAILARSMIDFSAAYDVSESESNRKLGALRRKGFSSFVRDEWTVLDEHDQQIGTISEDSTAMALARRFLPMANFIPQTFHLHDLSGRTFAEFRTFFNPFVHKMAVSVYEGCPIDPSVVLAGGILLVAIEGRQG